MASTACLKTLLPSMCTVCRACSTVACRGRHSRATRGLIAGSGARLPFAPQSEPRTPLSPCRRGLDDGRTGAVPEEHAGPPILPVHHLAHHLAAHHRRAARRPGHDQARRHLEGVDEAGAARRDVEGRHALDAQRALGPAGGGGKERVRGGGGHHQGVDGIGRDVGVGAGRAHRPRTQVRGGLVRGGDVSAFDAGALPDPGIGGVDASGQLVVAHHPGRQAGPGSHDLHGLHDSESACSGVQCGGRHRAVANDRAAQWRPRVAPEVVRAQGSPELSGTRRGTHGPWGDQSTARTTPAAISASISAVA